VRRQILRIQPHAAPQSGPGGFGLVFDEA
jgi:hypothetical protein